MKKKLFLPLSVLFLSHQLYADEFDFIELSLEELMKLQVVTAASGFEQNAHEVSSSVTIIEAAEWKARGAKNLTQALQGAVNFEVSSVTTGVNHDKYNIRGLSGSFGQQIVILIDGVPINELHNGGGTNYAEKTLQGYKRIEIIRSPGSVVYGADAFGGIINLVSYGIDELPNEINLSVGGFDTVNIGASKSFSVKGAKFQISANYQTYGDDPNRIVNRDLQTTLDEALNTSASHAPGRLNKSYESYAIKSKMEWDSLSVYFNGLDGSTGFGGGVAQALDPNEKIDHHQHIAGIDYDLSAFLEDTVFKGQLVISTWYNYQKANYPLTILPAGTTLPIGSDGNLNFVEPTTITTFTDGYIGQPGNSSKRYHLSIKHLFLISDAHKIRWEVGFQKQAYKAFEKKNFGPGILDGTETVVDGTLTNVTNTPYVYMPSKKRDFIFASIQDQWQVSDSLNINVGARFDDYSDFGGTFNPRVGLNWKATEKLTLRLFGGSAFRAPSFVDLYAQNNPILLGNANIQPEEVVTYELAGDYQFTNNLRSVITLFSYDAKSLIDSAVDPITGNNIAQNVGKQEAVGFEWEFQWRPFDNVDISSNYSYTDSDDGLSNKTKNTAKQLAAFVINWQITEKVHLNLASNRVMNRERSNLDLRAPIKDYTLVTGKVSYLALLKGLDISVSVNNLLDDDIRYPSDGTIPDDFPQAGRQWLAEALYHF